ncbi:hypothetical protein PHMEG_0003428 [Phytophthora megakarya]|uniref:Bzip transcription factor n=1 Tax=Phytophthora megakarya TaxID=4795 RepID=A0A225WY47_9STRA|nr:hypothetical protein PHMEG_0003428 [Phytophthora megakarya]
MDFCTLRPPNLRFLSDEIVGGVLQRSKANKFSYAPDNRFIQPSQTWCEPRNQYRPPTHNQPRARPVEHPQASNSKEVIPQRDAVAVLGLLSLTTQPKRKREETPSYTSHKVQCVAPEAPVPVPVNNQAETDTESLNSDKHEPQRPTQHRKMEDQRMINLEKQTRQLREEIEKFEERRRSASKAVPRHQNGWDVALEYFKLFRLGLQTPGRGRPAIHKRSESQLDFLRANMTADVVFSTGQGPDAMLRSWKCISMWFKDVEMELDVLDRGAAGSLAAMTKTSVTVTERTLRNVFPHLCSGSNELAKKLLGQRIVMRGLTRFEWDSSIGRFTSVVAYSDLLTPLLELLDSVEDVSRVFERSVISPDFQWRSMA